MSSLDDAVRRQELEDILANYVSWPETKAIWEAGIEVLNRDAIGGYDVSLQDGLEGKKVVMIFDLTNAKPWTVTSGINAELASQVADLVSQYLKDGKKVF